MRRSMYLLATLPWVLALAGCGGHAAASGGTDPSTGHAAVDGAQSSSGPPAVQPSFTRFHAPDFSILMETLDPLVKHSVKRTSVGVFRTSSYEALSANAILITETKLPVTGPQDLLAATRGQVEGLHGHLIETRSGPFHGFPGVASRFVTYNPTQTGFLEIFQVDNRIFELEHYDNGKVTEPTQALRDIVASFRYTG